MKIYDKKLSKNIFENISENFELKKNSKNVSKTF